MSFYSQCRGAGRCVGVDPSAQDAHYGNTVIQKGLFDEKYLEENQEKPDILFNRHMIEHLLSPPPADMLSLFARALPQGGLLYLETPRLDWILRNQLFFDFPYEHCAYYSDRFMSNLLKAAGFSIAAAEASYAGQYFSICARKTGSPQEISALPHSQIERTKSDFSRMAKLFYRERQERYSRLLSARGIYLWGASAKGVMCANLLRNMVIDGCIDKNPYKQGKFIPGTGHRVISPDDVSFPAVQTVLVENDVYLPEIMRNVKEIDLRIQVCSLHQVLGVGTDNVELHL